MLTFLSLLACSSAITLTIPKATIEQKLAEKFPIERGSPSLLQVQLSDPTIRLPGDDVLQLQLAVLATMPSLDEIDVPASAVAEDAGPGARAADVLRRLTSVAAQGLQAPKEQRSGAMGVQGVLTYQPQEGAFYIQEARITSLELDGEPPERLDKIRSLAELGISTALDTIPVYVLEQDIRQRAARHVIKAVHADPEGLRITLGP